MWKATLNREFDTAYKAMGLLSDQIKESELAWKPKSDNNWMTLGQLLRHCAHSCGWCCKGFVDGEWDMAAIDHAENPEGEGLMPAKYMPTVESLEHFRSLLAADEAIARAMVAKADENDLAAKETQAPWGGSGTLGQMLLDSVNHLSTHKTQLFYYLKMMGKPVNTHHLWAFGG